ncbi:phosphoenolpyruvate--protein phosphotransferase [Salisaeta longa]|uniref:phosphoenolpyruvate--protein phosphotransferase n=1 Tax=Salisaeta longa TaxID=503170 RepID=UPI000A005DD9|nr:phosphoenolpyruvate--protein phosphotransferase [Salisaeta longa]
MSDYDAPPARASLGRDVLTGQVLAPGLAAGPAYVYAPAAASAARQTIPSDAVDDELATFAAALAQARTTLDETIATAQETLGADSASILRAHRMILSDDALTEQVRGRIREQHESAHTAIRSVMRAHRERLEERATPHVRERSDDLADVEKRLLHALSQRSDGPSPPPGAIVLAEQLTPSDIVRFNQQDARGYVLAQGAATSHVAIIARALGVPVLVVDQALDRVAADAPLILDGGEGQLVVEPTPTARRYYEARKAHRAAVQEAQREQAQQPAETTDGRRVVLQANIEFLEELELLDRVGAAGIGLVRTEMLFVSQQPLSVTEDAQYQAFRRIAEAAHPAPATIRLLDIGGDKLVTASRAEANPFLGWRGLRILLDRPALMQRQLRAVLRANRHGALRLLLPMVAHLEEVERVQDAVATAAASLDADGVAHDPDLPVGLMVEVPAVAVQASAFAAHADFFSIGTNDLTQYTLAVDRGNPRVADRYDALHPAVLRLMEAATTAAHDASIEVSVCGELAHEPTALPALVGMGVDTLSMSPTRVPAVKRHLRGLSYRAARALLPSLLDAPSAAVVRKRSAALLDAHATDGAGTPHRAQQ